MSASKTCKLTGCRKRFKPSGRKIYCSTPCKRKAEYKRSKKETIVTEETVVSTTSRGNDYPEFVKKYAEKLQNKKLKASYGEFTSAINSLWPVYFLKNP